MPPFDRKYRPDEEAESDFEQRLTVGIGVTTFNRAPMLRNTLAAIRTHTRHDHVLFVADDGSSDETEALLEQLGVSYLAAGNRGIAWNKNRALFYLSNVCKCDVVILLEDDTFPNADGWEAVWIEAALRHGHVNLAPSHWDEPYITGDGSASDPFLSYVLTGQCSAFTRQALDMVGYMDTRFRRYGFEHVEHTYRLISCGYGGVAGYEPEQYFPYLISSDLTVSGLDKLPDMDGIAHNAPLFDKLKTEDRHRWAWLNDEEMAIFRCEMASVVGSDQRVKLQQDFGPDWFLTTFDGTAMLIDKDAPRLHGGTLSETSARIGLRVRGRSARIAVFDAGNTSWVHVKDSFNFETVAEYQQASLFDFVNAPTKGFGLRHNERFLCCDVSQGRKVTVTRPRLESWETFCFGGYATERAWR